jgi:hypothetical protein
MPTAAEYTEWASWFGERADEMGALLSAPLAAATPDVLAGGFLAVSIDVALRAAAENATSVATRLRALSDECTTRAQVCREHDAAMRRYESNQAAYVRAIVDYGERAQEAEANGQPFHGSPPWPPTAPPAPPSWVER